MHDLLQFCDVIDSIATLTPVTGPAASVFGTLLVRDKSLGVEAPVRTEVAIISRLRAHRTKLYLFLCWTFGGVSSSRLVREFRSTANMRGNVIAIQNSTHTVIAKSANPPQIIVMNEHRIAISCLLHDPR
jgi:hypothetical protein